MELKITHLRNDHCSSILEVEGSLGKYRKLAVESGQLTLDGHGVVLGWAGPQEQHRQRNSQQASATSTFGCGS